MRYWGVTFSTSFKLAFARDIFHTTLRLKLEFFCSLVLSRGCASVLHRHFNKLLTQTVLYKPKHNSPSQPDSRQQAGPAGI